MSTAFRRRVALTRGRPGVAAGGRDEGARGRPAPAGRMGSMRAELRIHQVSTGEDVLVLASEDRHVEAPNWTPDGRWLVVNADGRLYRVPPEPAGVDGSALTPIDTGDLA